MTFERAMPPPPRRKPGCVDRQEEHVWARFYPQSRSDPALALELLTELERDEVLRRKHRGLYLSCQRCVRVQEHRHARNQHVGRLVRLAARGLFVTLPQAVWRALRHAGQLLLACLPQGEKLDDSEDSASQLRWMLEREAYGLFDPALRVRARKAADKQAASASRVDAARGAPRANGASLPNGANGANGANGLSGPNGPNDPNAMNSAQSPVASAKSAAS